MGVVPSKRTFHQAVMYLDAYLYIIGGFDGIKLNDVHRILLATPVKPQLSLGNEGNIEK